MRKIVIIGSSGHAKVVIDIVERQGTHTIVGLIDSYRPLGEHTLGHPVLGAIATLPNLVDHHDIRGSIIAIGDNFTRANIAAQLAKLCPTLHLVTAIHPTASIAPSATIGLGSTIMAGAVVGPDCVVGRCCIINTGASLDHDSVLEDFASLAPGAITGGYCRIGTYSAIGIGATLRHRIAIGTHTVVGAGATVVSNIGDCCVAYGVPAQPIRTRAPDERYL